MLWSVYRFFSRDWIGQYWSGKEFYFTYWPFDFVRSLPVELMHVLLVIMGILALFITIGFLYRISMLAFFLSFTYLFLIEKARYLNHFYLIGIFCFLLIFLPLNRYWSVDSLLRPGIRSATLPGWCLWLLRFQIIVPMLFAGLAKLDVDWLTRGQPLIHWLSDGPLLPVIGQQIQTEPFVWLFVYGALLIDLLFFGYMTNRRTRFFGFGLVLAFHLLNSIWFSIGIFPSMMIVATLLFFGPDWPRRVWKDVVTPHPYRLPALIIGALVIGIAASTFLQDEGFDPLRFLFAAIGGGVWAYHLDEPFLRQKTRIKKSARLTTEKRWRVIIASALCVWIAFQIFIPVRHFVIPGGVDWTNEGHNFSWRMLLRTKHSEISFYLVYPDQPENQIKINGSEYLTPRQHRKMSERPEMILQFAHYLERKAVEEGKGGPAVRASVNTSLNLRPYQPLINPSVDLTEVKRPWFGHADWIPHLNRSMLP